MEVTLLVDLQPMDIKPNLKELAASQAAAMAAKATSKQVCSKNWTKFGKILQG